MDAYPPEFLLHLNPLLFVAGLPLESTETPDENDPFFSLAQSLAKVFISRKGFHVWDISRGSLCDFHVVLVEKVMSLFKLRPRNETSTSPQNVKFPPRKARPPPNTAAPLGAHSPISPLSPNSPLYPDGIMAPIWIRKHRDMIPSVFLLVLRLVDNRTAGGDNDDDRDRKLVEEILARKTVTLERGIKLAVVLLTSRSMLDDPDLDLRLSSIRRQSGLDSRASLFVLSPVSTAEVHNFVTRCA
jgi:hypothetical protein